jgi:divalent metal cation (Fe/Co/Zn/Cd) transporter
VAAAASVVVFRIKLIVYSMSGVMALLAEALRTLSEPAYCSSL